MSLTVQRGTLLCYRLFDLGDELLLSEAQRIFAEGERWKLSSAGSQSLSVPVPPLDLQLAPRPIEVAGTTWEARVTARLFEYGTASIRYALEIPPDTPLQTLIPLCGELYELEALDTLARAEAEALAEKLGDAIVAPEMWRDQESTTIVFVEAFDGHPTAEQILAEAPLVCQLLLGESYGRPLAQEEERELLRQSLSYLDDDLAVVYWGSALVVEPSGSSEIPDLLEFACSQLIGLRAYDDLLDRELAKIYDEVEQLGRGRLLFWSNYGTLLRAVQERWVGMTEFMERVENAIKVVGDLYLARLYRGALERYRVPEWQASVARKQDRVAQVYEFLKTETDTRRAQFLELAIALLIVAEILLALAGRWS